MRDVFCETSEITRRYEEYIGDVTRLLTFHGLKSGAAEDFGLLAAKLEESNAFRVDFSTLIRSVHDREQGKMSADQMLTVIALASGGERLVDGRSPAAGMARTLGLLRMLLAGVGLWSDTNDLDPSQPPAKTEVEAHRQVTGNPVAAASPKTSRKSSASAQANLNRELTALRVKLDSIERRVSETKAAPRHDPKNQAAIAPVETRSKDARQEESPPSRLEGSIPKGTSQRRMQAAIASGLVAPEMRAEPTSEALAENSTHGLEAPSFKSDLDENGAEAARWMKAGEPPQETNPPLPNPAADEPVLREAPFTHSMIDPDHPSLDGAHPGTVADSVYKVQEDPSPAYQDERIKAVFMGLTRHPGSEKATQVERPQPGEQRRERILARLQPPQQRWIVGLSAAVLVIVGAAKLGWQAKGDGPTREIGAFASETHEATSVSGRSLPVQDPSKDAPVPPHDAEAKLGDPDKPDRLLRVNTISQGIGRPPRLAVPLIQGSNVQKGPAAEAKVVQNVPVTKAQEDLRQRDLRTEESSGNKTIEVASSEMQKRLLFSRKPVYPAEALSQHANGAVVLNALIAKDGTVRRMDVVGGEPALIKSAMAAVSWRRYQPYRLRGKPVDVLTQVTIKYPPL